MLAEAARRSRTIADVLRLLDIRITGGAHAHIKRRLLAAGIDISHFTGRPDLSQRGSPHRLDPDDILILRPESDRRRPGTLLTRALVASGVPLACAACGIGPQWNDRPLVLHVDHVNGDYADCRATNLRFLCPNCHSQTSTYAGRGKRPTERSQTRPVKRPPETSLTVDEAARLLGCSRSHFYRLRAELRDGSRTLAEQADREERNRRVVEYAVAHPMEGPRRVSDALRTISSGSIDVSPSGVWNILRAAGLNTARARREMGGTG